MKTSTFHFPKTADVPITGERYIPGTLGPIQLEHFHRYLFTLKFAENSDVVDVASGEGYGSALLSQVAKSVIGIDVDSDIVQHANRCYGSQSLSFRSGNATKLPCDSASVDVVASFETIEHLEDHDSFLAEVKRVLRADGLLVVSTPDRPVYNATLTEKNQYHLKELDRLEFQDLLSKYFRNFKIFEQRSIHGSVMADILEAGDGMEFFHSEDGTDFEAFQNKMDSPFLVAVASDGALPPCGPSVMNSMGEIEKLRGDLGFAVPEMLRLQAQIPLLEQRYAELETQMKAQSEQLQAQRAQIETQREQLRKAETFAELARAETQYLRQRLKELEIA
jgi:SAM-dependent methyltransferase